MNVAVKPEEGGGPLSFELSFPTVGAYLQSCKTHLRRGVILLRSESPIPASQPVTVLLSPPHLKQEVRIQCHLKGEEQEGYLLEMEPLGRRERVILGTYTSLAEAIWQECMESMEARAPQPPPRVVEAAHRWSPPKIDEEDEEAPTLASLTEALRTSGSLKRSALEEEDGEEEHDSLITLPPGGVPIALGSPDSEGDASAPPLQSPSTTTSIGPEAGLRLSHDDPPVDPDEIIPPEAAMIWSLEVDADTGLPLKGPFDALSPMAALVRITAARGTGVLNLRGTGAVTRLHLLRGRVIEMEDPGHGSNSRLGQILLKMGRLKAPDRDMALEETKSSGMRLGVWLMRNRRASEETIRRAMEAQIRYRLGNIERGTSGAFRFQRLPVTAGKGAPLVNPVRALYGKWSKLLANRKPEEVLKVESGVSGKTIQATEEGQLALHELNFDDAERRLWQLISQGNDTLAQIYLSTPTSRRKTHGMIFAWERLGLLRFGDA